LTAAGPVARIGVSAVWRAGDAYRLSRERANQNETRE
jgi:hypothetical protein